MQALLNPELIRVAAQSPLGILALMIVLVGLLAALFFRQAPVQIRMVIFVLIFSGVSAFGFAVVRAIPIGDGGGRSPLPTQTSVPTPAPTRTRPPPDPTVVWP